MALPSDADVRLILSRIRPAADWGWKGGALNDPANLDWRDQVQTEPTLQELEDGWTVIVAEEATKSTVRQQLITAYAPIVGRATSALTNTEQRLLLEILCYIMGGIDKETRVHLPANQWEAAKRILYP